MGGELLVAGGDSAKPLQTIDAALNNVPPLVGFFVELALACFLVLLVRDDRLDATLAQPLAQPSRRVALISSDLRWLLRPCYRFLQQGDRLLCLMFLPWTDRYRDGRTLPVADQVQFGAEPAPAAAQSVVLRFAGRWIFFSPPQRPTGAPG
jgi:hypothetical protein